MSGREGQKGQSPDALIGGQVRRLRENAGLRQDELAEEISALGWNGSTVAKVERGERALKFYEAVMLCEHLPGLAYDKLYDTLGGVRVRDAVQRSAKPRKSPDAERRAAASLGVSAAELQRRAERAWGRGFTQERDARIAQRAEQGQPSGRGAASHVARELVDELRTQPQPKGRKK